jgi:hypothetical protein
MRDVISQYQSGAIKPVVGRAIDFDAIPAEIEAMANRETIGRTVVIL